MSKIKVSDFLKKLFTQAGVDAKDGDIILAASGLREVELPDDFEQKFDAAYLTLDRAENELKGRISNSLKTEHFAHFASDLERKSLKPLIDSLPPEFQAKINSLEKSNRIYGIMETINEAMAQIKNNGSSEDIKKVNEAHRKMVDDLNKTILDKDTIIKTKDSDYESRIAENKIDYALRGKIGLYKLAPEFEKRRSFIEDLTLTSLKNKGLSVEFDKENPQVMNLLQKKEGAITHLYEGNSKVTLENFLEKELADFTIKSNGSGSGQPTNPPSNPTAIQPPSDRPMSLSDMMVRDSG